MSATNGFCVTLLLQPQINIFQTANHVCTALVQASSVKQHCSDFESLSTEKRNASVYKWNLDSCSHLPVMIPWTAKSRCDLNALGSSRQPLPLRALPHQTKTRLLKPLEILPTYPRRAPFEFHAPKARCDRAPSRKKLPGPYRQAAGSSAPPKGPTPSFAVGFPQ